ncbi:MAG: MaoC family dehydratase [Planctomycetes bacterium]|nr:MaoC family dehydratase [Planctomycetota bacterium]
MTRIINAGELAALVGQRLGSSDWVQITQDMVNAFAEATGDRQWIHCDPQRAGAESPYGGPIAHGFLTLSLGPVLADQVFSVAGSRLTINYGLNRVRFPSAVRVGSRVRMHVDLLGFQEMPGALQVTLNETVEIDKAEKPACVAEAVVRFIL